MISSESRSSIIIASNKKQVAPCFKKFYARYKTFFNETLMYLYLFCLFLINFNINVAAAYTQIALPSRTYTTTTSGLKSDIFSARTSTTYAPHHLKFTKSMYGTSSTSFSQAKPSPNLTQINQFKHHSRASRDCTTPQGSSVKSNSIQDMNLEQFIGFALVLLLSAKPWLSLYYEMFYAGLILENELPSSLHHIAIPVFYLLLNSMYYQFFKVLKIDKITLLKRTAGISLVLHCIARTFTYSLSPHPHGTILTGNLFSLLSVTTYEARLILIFAHFVGSFLATYFTYNNK